MARGRLITIEGLDGAGKTTLATGLETELKELGIDVELLREPGGVPAAERVRDLVKDPEVRIQPRAEALLYAAARAQLVQEAVEPRLEAGTWILLDRFVDSSLAYQGGGRELGVQEIRAINEFATDGLTADRTLLLLLEPAVGLSRAGSRPGPADRLEREHQPFFERIAAAYADLAASDPIRIRVLDATLPPPTVLANAVEQLADLLP
ncbi:MAG: dTMP kinase [Actinobacteria bacterium]|jgi:dTMP kinase|nr:MAG: dTMP kinase [Actinomycetota bacterium]